MALTLKAPPKLIPATDISYYGLPDDVADITLTVTTRINQRLQNVKLDIVEIGKDLTLVKEKLPHGLFGKWIAREFGWGDNRTAQNYMNAARLAAETCPEVIELLPQKVVYELAAKSTPAEVKSAILAEVEKTGTPPETATVLKQIAAAKQLKEKQAEALAGDGKDKPAVEAAKMLRAALGSKYVKFRELLLVGGPMAFLTALDALEAKK